MTRLCVACAVALFSPTLALGDTRHVLLSSQTSNVRVLTVRGTSPAAAVVVASGVDGWRGLTSDISDRLAADGFAVIGLDTKSYVIEGTRRSGALSPALVAEDYLALLRRVHEWLPDLQRVFLLGVSEGGGLALVAAADPRLHEQVAGVVSIDTPSTVSLRSPYWNWTSWITHKDGEDVAVAVVDYLAAVAPVPVAFIYGTHNIEAPIDSAHQIFESGGEPRRLTVIGTDRSLNDAREPLFNAVHECLSWSAHVMRPLSTEVSAVDVLTAGNAL